MVYPLGSLLKPLFLSLIREVKGIENLSKEKVFIIASNHSSLLDPVFIAFALNKHINKKVYFISSAPNYLDLLGNFLFSEFGRSIHFNPKGGVSFMRSSLEHIRKGDIVAIFPEGITNKKSGLRRGKTGVARLALRAKVPILPVGIKGTFSLLYHFNRWILKPRKTITIKIGRPISFKKYCVRDNDYIVLRKITNTVMKEIAELLGKKYSF